MAPCPVLTIKYAVTEFAPRRILFPFNFTPETDQAVPGLRQVQALFPDAELHLLQVVAEEEEVDAAQARTMAFAQRHGLKRAQSAIFKDDSPISGISACARQVQADLLIVPTHGRTGLSRLLHTASPKPWLLTPSSWVCSHKACHCVGGQGGVRSEWSGSARKNSSDASRGGVHPSD